MKIIYFNLQFCYNVNKQGNRCVQSNKQYGSQLKELAHYFHTIMIRNITREQSDSGGLAAKAVKGRMKSSQFDQNKKNLVRFYLRIYY